MTFDGFSIRLPNAVAGMHSHYVWLWSRPRAVRLLFVNYLT